MTQPTAYVIDDDYAVRDSIHMLLELRGYTVRSFVSGLAFLRGGRPNKHGCLIIDMDMPGMGGIELLDRLRGEGVTTPAIFMTGGLSAGRRAAMDRTDALLLEKPFVGSELVRCIEKMLGRYQA
jgi:two-component system, LuxR family, response regulator FixJ